MLEFKYSETISLDELLQTDCSQTERILTPAVTGKAGRILDRPDGEIHAKQALAEIESSLATSEEVSLFALLDPRLVGVLFLGVSLAVSQQWGGINVIFRYAEEVFSAAGYHVSDILLNIVITGAANLAFTLVAIALVDKVGRRKLMLFGSVALTLIYCLGRAPNLWVEKSARRSGFPKLFPAATELTAPECDDGIRAPDGPMHAGQL